jgi:L,D-peptidoglycan transpeptidase YkuD (ErfK/YbiS/YcfS/YnhG family)
MEIIVKADATIAWKERRARCALGRSGITEQKTEGDGATPAGRFALRRILYRDDRIAVPQTVLPATALSQTDGWCDDPGDAGYNRPVALPYPGRHERLWRDDGLYDLIVVIGHNDDPPVAGAGSAVFIHVAAPDWAPTEGCVGLDLSDLQDLIAACDGADFVTVTAPED